MIFSQNILYKFSTSIEKKKVVDLPALSIRPRNIASLSLLFCMDGSDCQVVDPKECHFVFSPWVMRHVKALNLFKRGARDNLDVNGLLH